MPTNRFTGAAAVSRDGVNAGSIESSSGKRQRDAGAAEERPSRNVLLGNKHRRLPTADSVRRYRQLLDRLFTRIWNCGLFTTPSTIAENRLSSFATSFAIARIVGMSVYSMPRPTAYVINFSTNIRTNCGE